MAMSVSVMPAMAADTTQTATAAGSKDATVSYSKGSSFTVTIPDGEVLKLKASVVSEGVVFISNC